MAETILRIPGVVANEIDNSQPTPTTPTGIPAGIIGTAEQGPAFVPKYFGVGGYQPIFGDISSAYYGSLAASLWLSNGGGSCVYIRVLGAGDCKARNSDGTVTNAGFTVGNEIPQLNDVVGSNPYANESATFGIKGRTYFLGCFMSESNGSTIFSDAGIQNASEVKATATITAISASPGDYAGGKLVITDTLNNSVTYLLCNGTNGGSLSASPATGDDANTVGGTAGEVCVQLSAILDQADIAQEIQSAINSTLGNNEGTANSVITLSESSGVLTLTQTNPGLIGNKIITRTVITDDAVYTIAGFSGGLGGAVPILRGVLLAPSGVILHLSGCANANGNDVASMTTTAGTNNSIFGNKGGITGSIDLNSRSFVMIMNGFKGEGGALTAENNPYITASFDPTVSSYFGNIFNKDPLKIEEKGHLLLADFPIHEAIANITGSGIISAGSTSKGTTIGQANRFEDVAFLLTSSIERGADAGTLAGVPDYEDFRDRFVNATSPYIISQNYGGRPYDLFKLERIDDGEIDNKYFIKIQNIIPAIDSNSYGSFDLLIYDIETDETIKTFPGCSFDPSNVNYIGRLIGDRKEYFDFDNSVDSQKIISLGSFPNQSDKFRIVLSDDLIAGNVPKNALPMGHRGPGHLVTSGSLLTTENDSLYALSDILQKTIQIPFPYKKSINFLGESGGNVPNVELYWGTQLKLESIVNDLNNTSGDNIINNWTKYFPRHRKNTAPFFSFDKPGNETSSVTLLDTDRFNYNKFSLENIKVRTGSNVDASITIADSTNWVSASYVRSGIIETDDDAKTRALSVDDLKNSTNRNYAKFIVPVINGFDGHNIFSAEKAKMSYRATKMEIDDQINQGGLNGPTISAYKKAIDIMGSKTDADIQILSLPGQRHPIITDYAISAVENRFDSLLIMDIEERDIYNTVVTTSLQKSTKDGYGVSITNTVNDFKNRNLNSSFAAAYFPDITIKIGNDEYSDVPPSVMALGGIAKSDQTKGVSFYAPAGVNRTTLGNVISVSGPSINTNELGEYVYEADINPIIALNDAGPFINGQKTLLRAQSSLDRIDVRRLLIDVRRKVKAIANTLLFEPNRESTLAKFSSLVNPIMSGYRDKGGISRYKVVIDSSTTTQADIENNTIKGKIYLQPNNSIEFIALDFEVNNTIN